jgi:flagellar hook-associated protein 3 FlgL
VIQSIDGATQKFLTDLARFQAATDKAQREISSGLRVERASDAPQQVGDILELRGELGWNTQILANLNQVKAETDTSEEVLSQAVQLLDQASTLGSQGTGSFVSADQRLRLAGQVQGILTQLVGISRTTCSGSYLFSGDQADAPVYELSLGSSNGVNELITPSATRQVLDGDGIALPVSRTAQQIFDSSSASVFASVNGLRVALESNSVSDIQAALEPLRNAGDHLNTELSYYGGLQDRINSAISRARQTGVQRQTELSGQCDADLVAATLELNQGQLHQQAALSARARLPAGSLFDYLK